MDRSSRLDISSYIHILGRFIPTISGGGTKHREGKIDEAFLADLGLDAGALYYICGPPPVTHSNVNTLRDMVAQDSRIRHEPYWQPRYEINV